LKKRIEILVKTGELEKIAMIEQLPLELAVMEMVGKKETRDEILDSRNKKPEIEEKITEKVAEVETKEKVVVNLAQVEEKWGEILSAVKPYNHSVEAFLRAARPKKMIDGGLIIEVFYKFHKEKLEEAKNRKIVEIGLDKVFGGFLKFDCVLAEGGKKKEIRVEKQETRNEGSEIYDVAKDIFG